MSRIFISYSRSDKSVVDELIRRLEAAGHEVWIDRGGIRGGEQWRQEIVEAIEGNNAFLLILSKNSTESDHVRTEIDLAMESKKRIIPIDIQQVVIPTMMKYQLAGLQRINMHADYENGFQELLLTLGGEQANETMPAIPTPAPIRREQKKTRTTAALISGIVILVFLFSWIGYRFLKGAPDAEEASRPMLILQATPGSISPTETSALLPTSLAGEQAVPGGLTNIEEIEPRLLRANIRLSEPGDEESTRSYFTDPESAYNKLAVALLEVVGERRFGQPINFDVVEKWYSELAGSDYADRGHFDLESVKGALIEAHNDYYGDTATSLDDLLEASQEQTSLDTLTTVEQIEPLLLEANIHLSEPEEEERTRSYFTGPESAYHKLAVASLKVVGARRFKQYINLDMVDQWYTQAVGSGYAERGPLDLEIVKESLLDAHNDYWSDNAASLDGLLEPLN